MDELIDVEDGPYTVQRATWCTYEVVILQALLYKSNRCQLMNVISYWLMFVESLLWHAAKSRNRE
jgi:hypothetical protein